MAINHQFRWGGRGLIIDDLLARLMELMTELTWIRISWWEGWGVELGVGVEHPRLGFVKNP